MQKVYPVPTHFEEYAHTTDIEYAQRYQLSIDNPDAFWAQQAKIIDWIKPFTQVQDCSFDKKDLHIKWFADGELNVSANCLDRHVKKHPHKTALIWEGDHPSRHKTVSYKELYDEVCRFANVLKKYGIKKGDRVVLYMPMVVEAAVAMLACTRIGAVHCVVFGGFSPSAIASRIADSKAKLVITADTSLRAGRILPLKDNVDLALEQEGTESVEKVIVVYRNAQPIQMKEGRDVWYHDVIMTVDEHCPPEPMNAEDPLFILYTSGSTGKPKGVLHTTGGYLVYVASTFKEVFDIKPDDVYWCTADIGWVTGHSYTLYGPLANGATTVLFEGVPQYPTWARMGHVVDKHKVSILYTAPTAIRAMMREGDAYVRESNRSSLRLLGSVGEPINPEAWHWYHDVVGEGRCPIVDTWWQTETGGILISPLPGAVALKPGSATKPFFGIQPAIVDADGNELEGEAEGNLVIKGSWPAQIRDVWGDHERLYTTYFATYPNYYFAGDGARRDKDGYYWITGRVDDVLNVSGHRLSTAEIESALVLHEAVAEAAVVGIAHELKGQGIGVFVTLQNGVAGTDALKKELIQWVRKELGAIATLDVVYWADALPKTRSGKIMRRILRKVVANELDSLGDTSTLANPEAVDTIIEIVHGKQ